jgi:citrate/tricarballylate utilization protein
MLATDALKETQRLMTICNSCRYCEGLCAVFPAMETRRTFAQGDLDYLANLCHGCGACYDACQFSPPHAFNVNVPATLAQLRSESYARYAWPPVAARLFHRNGAAIAVIAAVSIATFVFYFSMTSKSAPALAQAHNLPSFYRQMPHSLMVLVFGAAFLNALLALALGVRRFWVDIGAAGATRPNGHSIWQAVHDAGRLRYLDGRGVSCASPEGSIDTRRPAHHLVLYGFLLCFASTAVATLYHYVFGRDAPYPWYDVPVALGTLGGVGLVAGSALLFKNKIKRDPVLADPDARGMEAAFLLMLLLTGVSGLALLLLRNTPALAVLLPLHLGIAFGFFITMPYGKFVHGVYRFVALVHYARDRAQEH